MYCASSRDGRYVLLLANKQVKPVFLSFSSISCFPVVDGRPSMRNITFDANSLLEAGNIDTCIQVSPIIMVWVVTKLYSDF